MIVTVFLRLRFFQHAIRLVGHAAEIQFSFRFQPRDQRVRIHLLFPIRLVELAGDIQKIEILFGKQRSVRVDDVLLLIARARQGLPQIPLLAQFVCGYTCGDLGEAGDALPLFLRTGHGCDSVHTVAETADIVIEFSGHVCGCLAGERLDQELSRMALLADPVDLPVTFGSSGHGSDRVIQHVPYLLAGILAIRVETEHAVRLVMTYRILQIFQGHFV